VSTCLSFVYFFVLAVNSRVQRRADKIALDAGDSGVEQTIDRREKSRAGVGGKTISETIEDHYGCSYYGMRIGNLTQGFEW